MNYSHQIKERYAAGNGNPLQYSCLEKPMDGGAWQATVHGVTKSQTRLSDFTFPFTFMHWRRKWQPTLVFLPGESQGQRSLVGCHLWGRTELDTTEATQQQQQQGEINQTSHLQANIIGCIIGRDREKEKKKEKAKEERGGEKRKESVLCAGYKKYL